MRFLPLVAAQDPGAYDRWACRWLARWLAETSGATIDAAVALAALPVESEAAEMLKQAGLYVMRGSAQR